MAGLGAKAEGLAWLGDAFPGSVPAFVAVPFAEVLVDGDTWLRDARAAAADALAGSATGGGEGDPRHRGDAGDGERGGGPGAGKRGDTRDHRAHPHPDTHAALASVRDRVVVDADALGRALVRARDRSRALGSSVAVRTSALAEDGEALSFAGQYHTALNVEASQMADAVADCARSLISDRVIAYARAAGLDSLDVGGSVVVQTMAPSGAAGVVFTQMASGDTEVAWSTAGPDAVVSGEEAQRFAWPLTEPLPRRAPIPVELLSIARRIQASRGPSDVEFSVARGRVHLLQVRPVTAATAATSLTWDSSNIGENYPGVTLPLTYSFIREVYADVYPAFFRLLGRSDRSLRAHQAVFRNTLGYVRGGVHYQIDNWFEMAAMLPGGKANQEFFSAMLQPVKDGQTRERPRPGLRGAVPLAAGLARFAWALVDSERRSRRFRRKFDARYTRYRAIDFGGLTAGAALSTLTRIRTDLLALWAVPILNDVRLMVAHGLLSRRFGDDRRAEYLAYLSGLTDRASIAPLEALSALGQALSQAGVTTADAPLTDEARSLIEDYLAHFGGRAPDELQLENPRLGDDHATVVALAIGAAAAPQRTHSDAATGSGLLTRVLGHQVRRAIDHRERFRFNRAQVFGIARDCYLAVGSRFADEGAIDHAEDVFWLTVDEVDAAVFGHAWDTDLRSIVARRRERLPQYERDRPARRVTSTSDVAGLRLVDDAPAGDADLAGVGVAPGVLEAPVVVLTEFDAHADVAGKVLVAPHADPGWTLLIVSAAAVITERGNALSHVAIVGRELGIPVVVGAAGATRTLSDGDVVQVDGTRGEINVRST